MQLITATTEDRLIELTESYIPAWREKMSNSERKLATDMIVRYRNYGNIMKVDPFELRSFTQLYFKYVKQG